MTREEVNKERMSKEEIIDTLKGLVFGTFDRTTAKEREALDAVIEILETQKWTPCSEGFPKKNGEYLVTVKNGYREFGIWVGIENNWSEVIAWMPGPEPYKAESEE